MEYRPQPGTAPRVGNTAMAARIDSGPAQPYHEGSYALRVLEVRGRKSGKVIRVPLAVLKLGGNLYLISPDRERSWAKNLRAAGECDLAAGGRRDRYSAMPVETTDEAVAVLRTYVGQLTFAARQFPFVPDAPDDQIRAAAPSTAVFRLSPVT